MIQFYPYLPAPGHGRGRTRTELLWSPNGKRIAPEDGERTWIEDVTQPIDQRQAEPLPALEGGRSLQSRSWSPDGRTLAGGLTFHLSPNSVTQLSSFASRTYRVLPVFRDEAVTSRQAGRGPTERVHR